MSKKNRITFQISDVFREYQGGTVFWGRCTQGPIRLGDHFSIVYTLDKDYVPIEIRSLEIQVEAIQCYRRYVDELVYGYSGGLHFLGEISESIKTDQLITNMPLE